MKRSLPVLVLASLCVVSTALATTYVRVEKDGSKTYSDRPLPGGQPIELQPAQGYTAPPQPSSGSRIGYLQEEVDNFTYASCTVTPANDSTFTNPESVPIAVATNPPLRPTDTVILKIDGQNAGPPGTMNFTLSPVNRGTHTVSVSITSRTGRPVCNASSSFHVMRPSVNSPANSNRPARPNVPRPTPH